METQRLRGRSRGTRRALWRCVLATTFCGALVGVEAVPVRVEVDVARGLPAFHIVGLAETAVRESKERVRAALRNAGQDLPPRRITVNLAPADLRKSGGGYDLAIAIAVLAATEAIPPAAAARAMLVGELSLTGGLRPVKGALAHAFAAKEAALSIVVVPESNLGEAAAVGGIDVRGASDLGAVVGFLQGVCDLPRPGAVLCGIERPFDGLDAPDLGDVRGQPLARRALEVAAAGGHHLLLTGPPGCGKTMLARRLPGILPPLGREEAVETSLVHGAVRPLGRLLQERPFRAPHHTATTAALIGGGWPPRPGEASLAHAGVLFLDELPEFRRDAIESLREAMDAGEIAFARARTRVRMPARFQLVGAANPCRCGARECDCPPARVAAYRARLSGPLLDRFDIRVGMGPVDRRELLAGRAPESSATVRDRVVRARAAQRDRAAATGAPSNAALSPKALGEREVASLDSASLSLLTAAVERLRLSARAVDKIRRVARTIADLEGSDRVRVEHVAEAVQFRSEIQTPSPQRKKE